MIYYNTVGTNDFVRSKAFYDAVLGAIGVACVFDDHGFAGYGRTADQPQLFLGKPFDGKAATHGNGMMIAFEGGTVAGVRAFHAAALDNGGSCEGPPGFRPHYGPDFLLPMSVTQRATSSLPCAARRPNNHAWPAA